MSNDATTDEQLGLVYATRVSLSQSWVRIDAKGILLSAGMAVTVEVKTGQRRVLVLQGSLAADMRAQRIQTGKVVGRIGLEPITN